MNHFEIFSRLAGIENTPESVTAAWQDMKSAPDFIDSRNCGLLDAVQSGWYQSATDELFKGFPISADDRVLDVGCGAGGATLFCANRGAAVTFTDVVEEKIASLRERVAQTKARSSTGLVVDSTRLPLPDQCMSRIICMEVIEHVEDPAAFVTELARVGEPDALYLLAVPDATGERIQKAFAPDYYFQHPNHIHIFERADFAALVEGSGLEIVQRTTFGFYWTMWMFMYWVMTRNAKIELDGASHDIVQPPYPPLLNTWAKLWHDLIKMPEAAPMKAALDELLPKSQVIIARKPAA